MSRLTMIVLLAAALALSAARSAPVTAASATSHSVTFGALIPADCAYTVRAGDWLSKIAARYNTTWQRLAALNALRNPNLIYPGERLTVCAGAGGGSGGQLPHAIYHAARYPNYGAPGQCVWYAQSQRADLWLGGLGRNGGAYLLATVAPGRGYLTGHVPAVGALVVYQRGTQIAARLWANFTYGHVGIVRAVYPNGTFLIDAMSDGMVQRSVSWTHDGVSFIYG